jgi:pimeloyl-ACP methyl ester carboxylesterase
MQPDTRYARSGDVHIAYQIFGDGPTNPVVVPGFVSNIENYWDEPDLARWLHRLGSYARVAMFDKRGTGMSDRVAELPGLDQRMDDLRAVIDAAGMEQASVFAISEGGPLSVLFAATYPDRCRAMVLYGSFARARKEFVTEFLSYIDQSWGTGGSLPIFAPSRANDPGFQRWWGRFERLGASPAAAAGLMHMIGQIDVSGILPSIRVPTLVIHRTEDRAIPVKRGRFLAEHIPGARYIELPGADHVFFVGDNAGEIADAIQEFLTGSRAPVPVDGFSQRYSLPTSLARRRKLPRLATAAGAIFSKTITRQSGATSRAFAAMRLRRPALAFLRPSTVRRAACAALAQLPTRLDRLVSTFVPGYILASAK